jgi:hypothetical protein
METEMKMMTLQRKLTTGFLTDRDGRKTAVVIPIEEYEELMEDMIDVAACIERRNEQTLPWNQLKMELIADGLLPA